MALSRSRSPSKKKRRRKTRKVKNQINLTQKPRQSLKPRSLREK